MEGACSNFCCGEYCLSTHTDFVQLLNCHHQNFLPFWVGTLSFLKEWEPDISFSRDWQITMFWGHKMTESVIPDRTFDIKTSRGKLVYSLAQLICDFGTLTTLWSELIPGLFYSDLFDDPIWKSIAFETPELRGKSIFFESDKSSVLVGSFSFKWCSPHLLTRSGYIRMYSVFLLKKTETDIWLPFF